MLVRKSLETPWALCPQYEQVRYDKRASKGKPQPSRHDKNHTSSTVSLVLILSSSLISISGTGGEITVSIVTSS